MAQILPHKTLIGPDQVHFYISQVQHLFIHLEGQPSLKRCIYPGVIVCVYCLSANRELDTHGCLILLLKCKDSPESVLFVCSLVTLDWRKLNHNLLKYRNKIQSPH